VNRWLVSTMSAALVAIGALATAGLMPRPEVSEENVVLAGNSGGHDNRYSFDIKASSVRGLYPGATRPINLVFTNSYGFPLRLTSVTGELVSSSKRGCRPTASNLKVSPYRGGLPLTVPAKGRATAGHLDVRMPNSVVDACQRAEFTIRITGSATQATR
jgi:hypothetical protein